MTKTLSIARANLARARGLRDELRSIDEAAGAANRDYTADEKNTINVYRDEITACETRANGILELEERGATVDAASRHLAGVVPDLGSGSIETRSVGAISPIEFTSDQIHDLHDAYMRRREAAIQVETRSITAPPMATIPAYRPDPVYFRREPTRLASLIPTQPVANASVTYYTQGTAASAAATVAEGANKPESTPGWTAVTTTVRKIAHYADVSKEALDDFPNFSTVVTDEMRRGLINAENLQLLSGDGTGTNLTGMLIASGILTYAPGSAEARYVSIRHAMTLLRNGSSFAEPEIVVLNPSDWELFDLSNSTSAGLHAVMDNDTPGQSSALAGSPSRTAWGNTIALSSQISAGVALVANLTDGVVLFEREPATVFVDPYSQSKANMVRFICEERLALGVVRPTALLKTTFNGAA